MKFLFKKGHPSFHTKEGDYKRSLALKGRKHSEERKKKISNALKGKKKKPMSEETKLKLSVINKKNPTSFWMGKKRPQGENNPRWKGGYENKLLLNNQRRIKKIGNGGTHTLGEWENLLAQYNWTCPCCKAKKPMIVLTRDHIIPISKGGSDNIENIQPLCKRCNSLKHSKTIKY